MKGIVAMSLDVDIHRAFMQKYRGFASQIHQDVEKSMLGLDTDFSDYKPTEIDLKIKEATEKKQRLIVELNALQTQKQKYEEDHEKIEKQKIIDIEVTKRIQSENLDLYNQLDPYDRTKIKIERMKAIKDGTVPIETTDLEYFEKYYNKNK
jgi:hypothetical protein